MYCIYNGIYVRATCFDLVVHPQAVQENRSKSCLGFLHCGIQNAYKFELQKQKYISLYKIKLFKSFNLKLETYLIRGTLKSLYIKESIRLF